MSDSIFTKIIKGEIPCEKIYEDNKTIAFLDLRPLVPGHALVVPKVQIEHFDELSDDDYKATWKTVRLVAKRLKKVTGAKRICMRIEGFDVPHVHVHVYPCNNPEEFYGDTRRFEKEPNHQALSQMAKKLAF